MFSAVASSCLCRAVGIQFSARAACLRPDAAQIAGGVSAIVARPDAVVVPVIRSVDSLYRDGLLERDQPVHHRRHRRDLNAHGITNIQTSAQAAEDRQVLMARGNAAAPACPGAEGARDEMN
jgi:hypothetical protein